MTKEEFERIRPLSKEEYSNRLIGCSQECEGTFKIKDGKVTDIHLTRVALIPKFKDGAKE